MCAIFNRSIHVQYIYLPVFAHYRYWLLISNNENKLKFVKNGPNFPTYLPPKKLTLFVKMTKIMYNIKVLPAVLI